MPPPCAQQPALYQPWAACLQSCTAPALPRVGRGCRVKSLLCDPCSHVVSLPLEEAEDHTTEKEGRDPEEWSLGRRQEQGRMPPHYKVAHPGQEGRKHGHPYHPSPSGACHHVTTFHSSTRCRLGYLSHSSAVTVLLPTVNSANTLAELLPSRAERSRAQTTAFLSLHVLKFSEVLDICTLEAACMQYRHGVCVAVACLCSCRTGCRTTRLSTGITKEREDSKSSCLEQAALSQLPREQAALLSAPSESEMNVSIP